MKTTVPTPSPSVARRAPRWPVAALLALTLGPGCYVRTQRFPGPLEPTVDPLPRGTADLVEAGPEEALIVRLSDPVLVRPAGTAATRALKFHDKRARLAAGAWVQTGAGGKAEVLLGDGARVELSGTCAGVLGSESRREPAFTLRSVTRATFSFVAPAQVALPGGALLAADTGPFVVEGLGPHELRLRNRSLGSGRIAYRDVLIDLAPGEAVDLAIPPSGTAPFQRDPAFRTLVTDDAPIETRGELEVLEAESGARLRALGPHEIVAHGLVLRLDTGDEVIIQGIGERKARAVDSGTGEN